MAINYPNGSITSAVLQVVSGASGSYTTHSSNVWGYAPCDVGITPQSTSNKILLIATGLYWCNTGNEQTLKFMRYDNSSWSNITHGEATIDHANRGGPFGNHQTGSAGWEAQGYALIGMDEPNTTSIRYYRAWGKTNEGSSNANRWYWNRGWQTSGNDSFSGMNHILALEIEG